MRGCAVLAFPFGLGRPSGKRKSLVSTEVCFQYCLCLLRKQFVKGNVTVILGHIHNKIFGCKSGGIAHRLQVNTV